MRMILIAAAAGLALSLTAAAQSNGPAPGSTPPAAGPPGRYAIAPAGDGFVRLDTQTGTVSHCGRREGAWLCEPAVESSGEIFSAMQAMNERLGMLAEEVSGLSAEVAKLRQRTDGLEATALRADNKLTAEEQQEMEKVLGFTDQLMRRLFGMVAEMKRSEQQPR